MRIRCSIGLGRGAVLLVCAATLASSHYQGRTTYTAQSRTDGAQSNNVTVTSIPFGEMNARDVYNASGVVSLADSRFLFCDNNSNDALFELDLTADGQKKGALKKRPFQGLAAGAIDDLEAMTLAKKGGHRFVIVASSLSIKGTKGGTSNKVRPSGLLRVRVKSDGSLLAENMPGFRDWFIQHVPEIAASATLHPDDAGLNIEGLAWDPSHHALLFGVRTPLSAGKPLVVPVRVRNLAAAWTTGNLKISPPIQLSLDGAESAYGIRSIEYIASLRSFLVIVGNAISGEKMPYVLYEWDGNRQGKMRRLNVTFAEKMKPEGVTSGTIGGRPVLLFVDDAGGYQVLWLDKTPL